MVIYMPTQLPLDIHDTLSNFGLDSISISVSNSREQCLRTLA